MRAEKMKKKAGCSNDSIKIGNKCYPKEKIESILNIKAGYMHDAPIGEHLLKMKKSEIEQLFESFSEFKHYE
jgi:hypothetical protein